MSLNTIDELLQESAMLVEWAEVVQDNLNEKVNELIEEYELNDLTNKVTELLTAVNAYLRRFNEFMDRNT